MSLLSGQSDRRGRLTVHPEEIAEKGADMRANENGATGAKIKDLP